MVTFHCVIALWMIEHAIGQWLHDIFNISCKDAYFSLCNLLHCWFWMNEHATGYYYTLGRATIARYCQSGSRLCRDSHGKLNFLGTVSLFDWEDKRKEVWIWCSFYRDFLVKLLIWISERLFHWWDKRISSPWHVACTHWLVRVHCTGCMQDFLHI